ncbi:hypothetical protein Q9Q95_13280 [Sphingomonas sp. DG1-23]|uniref:hypothetical protein n=1 Tax=Sphingomonas sp. DG1-23 TaxID=3068316 RepID=UPI00273EC433|nr:hypothetical protein [Sphingomonas sp. DG1-23]MDP5279901.1 hypothetical protein [Sphingomonas sp. DG1-23]
MDNDAFLAEARAVLADLGIEAPKPGLVEDLHQDLSYYAVFDEDGAAIGFYHEAVHGPKLRPVIVARDSGDLATFPSAEVVFEPNPDCTIPSEAVRISDDEWLAHQDANSGTADG